MTLDSWKSLFEVVGVLAAGIAFASGVGVLWTGHRISERDAAEKATAARVLAAVQQQQMSRAFSPEQRTTLLKHLSNGPRCHIQVFVAISDDEGRRFAVAVESIFKDAGWSAESFHSTSDLIAPGIGLAQANPGEMTPCVAHLRAGFSAAGFKPFLQTYSPVGSEKAKSADEVVHLLVGPKPTSPL